MHNVLKTIHHSTTTNKIREASPKHRISCEAVAWIAAMEAASEALDAALVAALTVVERPPTVPVAPAPIPRLTEQNPSATQMASAICTDPS